MASRKPMVVQVPAPIAEEIGDAARRLRRSVGFVVRRALAAAPNADQALHHSERVPLTIATDEDDPADTLAKIKRATQGRSLEEALVSAWLTARGRFHAWIAREEEAAKAERADELDSALRDAKDPATLELRLTELAQSVYPKVRALVAQHPRAPSGVLQRLAVDREPYVRDAVAKRTC